MKTQLTPEQAAEALVNKIKRQDRNRNLDMKPITDFELYNLMRLAFAEGIEYERKRAIEFNLKNTKTSKK